MEPNRFNTQGTEYTQAPVREVDLGLQAFMRRVLNTMGLGLLVTGGVAYAVANIPALFNLIMGTPLAWVAMLAPLGFVWFGFSPKALMEKTAAQIQARFYLFSALFGLSLSTIFAVFTGASIARVFFITAAMFAGTSLWGYTTKKDLTGFGGFLFMGLIGLLIAMIVNIFMQSAMVHFITSAAGVFIFTGLIAFHTQMLKNVYHEAHGEETNNKMATMGALQLYISFINLFQFLLHFMGNQR